jgi:transposase
MKTMEEPMGNYLQMGSQQDIRALLELGWSHRRIAREAGVHREMVARYAKQLPAKPANPIAGSLAQNRPNPIPGPPSSAEPYHDFIQAGVNQGLTAQRIWQDLGEGRGYSRGYLSVQRYVRRLKQQRPEVADVMEHPPGAEAQVDYFQAPSPTFDAGRGQWRRPWVFRMTLSCSKHGYEEAMWTQDRRGFLRAHEHAFEAFGGVPKVIRHDYVARHIIVVLCPARFCGRSGRNPRSHGDKPPDAAAAGHITIRARRASAAEIGPTARWDWCGVPPKGPEARRLAGLPAWSSY